MLVYDLVDPQELVGFVRELTFDQFTLDDFLPNNNIDDIEYRFRRGRLTDQEAATYRAWDAEARIAARQGTQRVTGELAPISRKIRVGEEERHRLRALETGNDDPIIDQIFADAANMTRAVQARVELARGQVLSTGSVTIEEDGFVADVDFGVPSTNFVTASTPHDDPEADVIGEWTEWLEAYDEATDGEVPGVAVVSRKYVNNLLRNEGIRQLAATAVGGTPSLVTVDTVQQVFAAYGLPPMRTYDSRVRVGGTAVRPIPEDRVILLPGEGSVLGQTLFGVTAEALELAGEGFIEAEDAAGVVAVVEKTTDPVSTWTLASGISVPVLANPELLFVATAL